MVMMYYVDVDLPYIIYPNAWPKTLQGGYEKMLACFQRFINKIFVLDVNIVAPWCSGYHYYTTSFN